MEQSICFNNSHQTCKSCSSPVSIENVINKLSLTVSGREINDSGSAINKDHASDSKPTVTLTQCLSQKSLVSMSHH